MNLITLVGDERCVNGDERKRISSGGGCWHFQVKENVVIPCFGEAYCVQVAMAFGLSIIDMIWIFPVREVILLKGCEWLFLTYY